MQIKINLRFHLIPVRMTKIKNTADSLCWRCTARGNTLPLLVGAHTWTATVEINMAFSQKIWNWFTSKLSYTIVLVFIILGTYPKDAQSYHKNTWATMVLAVLFVIARNCNQSKWPSTEGLINKIWNSCTVEYYSAVKYNGIITFEGK